MNPLQALGPSFLFAAVLSAALPAQAADRMQAGLWEMSMPGVAAPIPKCWTSEDVKAINGSEANARAATQKMIAEMGNGWALIDLKLQGDTLSYSMVPPGGKAIPVSATYHGTTYESTSPAGTSKARRVGACP